MENIIVEGNVTASAVETTTKSKRKYTDRSKRPEPKRDRKTTKGHADRKMVYGRRLTCENNVKIINTLDEYEACIKIRRKQSDGKTETWVEGTDFDVQKNPNTQEIPGNSLSQELLSAVTLAATQAATSAVLSNIRKSSEINIDTFMYQSPLRGSRSIETDEIACQICQKSKYFQGALEINSQLIYCSIGTCGGAVHSDCIGLPALTEAEAHDLPMYYCRNHIKEGRRLKIILESD